MITHYKLEIICSAGSVAIKLVYTIALVFRQIIIKFIYSLCYTRFILKLNGFIFFIEINYNFIKKSVLHLIHLYMYLYTYIYIFI